MTSDIAIRARIPWGLQLLHDDIQNDTGANCNTASTATTIEVDIVAVHGLGAHPDHAWVRHQDLAAGIPNDVRWLMDLLPQTLRSQQPPIHARTFCFNYQSAWLGTNLTKNRLKNVAERMLDAIHHVRLQNGLTSDRPLILIGHSFGGLVIEQAVVTAGSSGGLYEYLIGQIGGIVLLGTPHRGSKLQPWGSILARMASLIDYGENVLMDNVDEKSMDLFDLIFGFMQIVIRMDLAKTNAVVCFAENQSTNYVDRVLKVSEWVRKKTSAMVVEEDSAVLPGVQYLVLDSDHSKLNKYTGVEDGNYVSVSSNIARIAIQAPQLIRRHRAEANANQPRHFVVPRERVSYFVGRENELQAILAYFSAQATTSSSMSSRTLVLYALGGQGKSQIALEYCRRSKKMYRGIFWINATSEQVALQSYQSIAKTLTEASPDSVNDPDTIIRLVTTALEDWDERWLLVFDNYDQPNSFPNVRRFIPTGERGDVIFTSRHRGTSRLGQMLEVPALARDDGADLLLRHYSQHAIEEQHRAIASEIVSRLGGLALAIDQAAAYLDHRQISPSQLDQFLIAFDTQKKKVKKVLAHTPNELWEYGTMQVHGELAQNQAISAFTTWEMSFSQLESNSAQRHADAAKFLSLSAFFDPVKISESLFRHYWIKKRSPAQWMQLFSTVADDSNSDAGNSDSNEQNISQDEGLNREAGVSASLPRWSSSQFWDLLVSAHRLSLVQNVFRDTDDGWACYSLHPLVRDWLQLRTSAERRRQLVRSSINVVASTVRQNRRASSTADEKLVILAHIETCLLNDAQFSQSGRKLGQEVESCETAVLFADFYQQCGLHKKSEELLQVALSTRTEKLGREDSSTLSVMKNLAVELDHQGKYEQAGEIYRETLKLSEKMLGKEHPDTLASLNNLALTLNYRGEYEQAEEIHRETLQLTERVLGKEHPDTLTSLNNLAMTLSNHGKHEQADEILRETLQLQEKILGREHPDTLTSLNNLAMTLSNHGKHEQAEEMYRETLRLRKKVLGKEHPETLQSMYNLAATLHDQRKYEDAEGILQQTTNLDEQVLGIEHPDTLASARYLAVVLHEQGKFDRAENLYREVIPRMKKVLGEKHPQTQKCIEWLTFLLQKKSEQTENTSSE